MKYLITKLTFLLSLGVLTLFAAVPYTATRQVLAAGPRAYSESPSGPAIVTARKSTDSRETPNRSAIAVLTLQSGAVITEWNQQAVALTVLPASALSPVQQTRVMAIVQVAVHDAVNGITGEYETYLSPGTPPENASPEAAAIAAAHQALTTLFPSQTAALDAFYSASLAAHGLSPDDAGIEYGRSAAAAILAARANDNSAQAQYEYTAPGAANPGVWTRINNAPALLPGWGNVTPWVLWSGSQFRPEAPPALDSKLYATDYNEIKEIGRSNSSTRTTDQSQIALFWRASPTAIWSPILTQVLAARDLDLSATARAYALFSLAGTDASISCWDTKYTYNNWRPQLAIRGGDLDGNDLTAGDETWTPFLPTPPHPEYSSGHTTISSAMASVLEAEFGDDPGVHFAVTLTGITREWDMFDQAVQEVIDARVYSGIHFRNSDIVGAREGRQVAHFVMTHALRLCTNSRPSCSKK
jgi:hypothetical protein